MTASPEAAALVERCPTCDREGTNCPTWDTLIRGTRPNSEVRQIALAAMRDCHAHRVIWRDRCLATEAAIRAALVEIDDTRAASRSPVVCGRLDRIAAGLRAALKTVAQTFCGYDFAGHVLDTAANRADLAVSL